MGIPLKEDRQYKQKHVICIGYKGECVVNYIGYIGSVLFKGIFQHRTLFPCHLLRINNIVGYIAASCTVIISVVIYQYLSLIL